ncbi:MAG: histidine phosphatase family protein [Alphaproteobacteria bacterium]
MKKNFYIIRHAEGLHQTDSTSWDKYGDKEIPLTHKGIKQSQETGAFLKQELDPKKTVIISSDFERAEQTAEEIANVSGISNSQKSTLLREQNFGLFTGVSTLQCYVKYPLEAKRFDVDSRKYGRYHVKSPQGESRADVVERVEDFFEKINDNVIENDNVENVVIVSHGVVSKAIAKILLKEDENWFNQQGDIENASVRSFSYQDGKYVDNGYIFTPVQKSANTKIISKIQDYSLRRA